MKSSFASPEELFYLYNAYTVVTLKYLISVLCYALATKMLSARFKILCTKYPGMPFCSIIGTAKSIIVFLEV